MEWLILGTLFWIGGCLEFKLNKILKTLEERE